MTEYEICRVLSSALKVPKHHNLLMVGGQPHTNNSGLDAIKPILMLIDRRSKVGHLATMAHNQGQICASSPYGLATKVDLADPAAFELLEAFIVQVVEHSTDLRNFAERNRDAFESANHTA